MRYCPEGRNTEPWDSGNVFARGRDLAGEQFAGCPYYRVWFCRSARHDDQPVPVAPDRGLQSVSAMIVS